MQAIPDMAIRISARRLRARLTALDDARAALADALSDATAIADPLAHPEGGRGSQVSDRTARGADRVLTARERLEAVEAWERIFRQVDRDFPPGTQEGKVRDLCLINARREGERWGRPCMTLTDLARAEGVDRQTIRRWKETILGRVAYYAAEAGLVRKEAGA